MKLLALSETLVLGPRSAQVSGPRHYADASGRYWLADHASHNNQKLMFDLEYRDFKAYGYLGNDDGFPEFSTLSGLSLAAAFIESYLEIKKKLVNP